jgi:ATP-dependent helicase/nuclease subunit B
MACELRWTRHGDEALEALADAVTAARADDPWAPVTVVTPSPSVAVATRRALARRLGGTVGVGFHALGAVAEQLAAPQLAAAGVGAGVDHELVVAAVRVALGEAPGGFAPIAGHRATWERIAAAVTEVDLLDDEARRRVATRGGVPAEVVRIHGVVRRRLGALGGSTAVTLATEVALAGGPRVAALGAVVVHLPRPLARAELALLGAVSEHLPVTLLAGATGDPAADAALAEDLAPLATAPPPPIEPATATEVVSANDVDDEVRAAVRALLALADQGTPLHRMALVHPAGPPYAQAVADVLRSTGIPHSGPSTRRLAQTVAGRVLRGLLDVEASSFGRQEVVDLWASGVLVDAAGHPVAGAAFDERSRRLGIIRGAERWHRALDADDADARARLERAAPGSDAARRAERSLEHDAAMRGAVGVLEELCASRPSTWADVATWAGDALDRLCGPSARRSWPPGEIDADQAIRTALGRLGGLDDIEPDPSDAVVRATIRAALDAPAPRTGPAGAGVLVTTVGAPPLVPLDAVAVVGLAEGHLPTVGADDGLLGDDLRRSVGLAVADDHRLEQRRAFLATLASARQHRIVTHARHDQRSGRSLVPSRWLVELVARASGTRPDVERLMAGRPVDGVRLVRSHGAGLGDVAAGDAAPLHEDELALASLVASGGLEGHPAADDPVLAGGSALLADRRSDRFTRFDGNLDGQGVDITASGVLSPTSLETYAQCPRRWFFAQALRLRPVERPEEIDRLSPRDKGSLAHRALERFFEEAIEAGSVPPPGVAWPAAAHDRLRAIVDEECDLVESRGITGHPRWWAHDRAEVHRVLQRVLHGDDDHRARLEVRPVAVELTFGRGEHPPLDVDLGDGRTLRLAGQADRVDAGDGRVVVWDYKYSGPTGFADLVRPEDKGGDPLAGGTKIQLVAYGMAAARHGAVAAGDDVEVVAWYWFLRPPDTNAAVGYVVDAELRDRFRRVLRVLADGIATGRFPARPGEHQWHRGTFEHCSWCDFDAICPRDRDEEWERVRLHPSLAALRALGEEGSASVLDPAAPPEEAR